MLLDRRGTLPLAVLVLSELWAGPNAGLDERHISDVGGSAWCPDHYSGQLVSGIIAHKADDGSTGLC